MEPENRKGFPGRRITDYPAPNDAEVAKVQADTGMDYLQAYRHVQQRTWIRENVKEQFPLGKSSHDGTDITGGTDGTDVIRKPDGKDKIDGA